MTGWGHDRHSERQVLMQAEFSILSFARPGGGEIPIGILMRDCVRDQLRPRLRHDWGTVADEEDAEVLAALADDLLQVGRQLGAQGLLEYLEDTASHAVRLGPRERIETEDLEQLLDTLYEKHVEGSGERPAAAGSRS